MEFAVCPHRILQINYVDDTYNNKRGLDSIKSATEK